MKYLLLRMKRFCGFIAGFVFFIAGIFKLLDPVGAGLVMKEYMDFLHVGFIAPVAKLSASVLAFAEVLVGTALVTGIWRRLTAVAALIFQVVFTMLSLLLVIYNPQMDCGCFGEVIHLTHFETLLKNIVLLVLLVIFAFPFRYLGGPKRHKYVSFMIVTLSVLAFTVYSWINIPFVDYTDFRPAVVLHAANTFGAVDENPYEAVFVYEKDNEIREFALDELPDSTWSFVETRTETRTDQASRSAALSFYDENGVYRDTLAAAGKVMIMSVYDPDSRPSVWEKAASFVAKARQTGFQPIVLVASTPDRMRLVYSVMPELEPVLKQALYFGDYKTLVALNRSNGGVTYFSDGYLVRKWSSNACPDISKLEEVYLGDDTETIVASDTRGSLAFQGFMLYVFAIMLLL